MFRRVLVFLYYNVCMILRKLLILIGICAYGLDLDDVYMSKNVQKLKGKKITLRGRIDAKGKCKDKCKIRIIAPLKNGFVRVYLEYEKKDALSVRQKWVSNPIIASCIFVDSKHYVQCID